MHPWAKLWRHMTSASLLLKSHLFKESCANSSPHLSHWKMQESPLIYSWATKSNEALTWGAPPTPVSSQFPHSLCSHDCTSLYELSILDMCCKQNHKPGSFCVCFLSLALRLSSLVGVGVRGSIVPLHGQILFHFTRCTLLIGWRTFALFLLFGCYGKCCFGTWLCRLYPSLFVYFSSCLILI